MLDCIHALNRIALAVCCAVIAWLPPTASAVTITPPPLDGMLARAGLVVEATVVAVDAGAGRLGEPRTRITLRVEDVLAGAAAGPGDRFTFEIPEGRLPDGRFVVLAEAPRLAVGERYLLLYRREAWHHTPVVGWSHGVLRRVSVDGSAAFVDVGGRCVVGLSRAGVQLGARVASAAPSPPGWPPNAALADRGPESAPGATPCLPAADVVRALRRRLDELGLAGVKAVARTPATGGWREAGASK